MTEKPSSSDIDSSTSDPVFPGPPVFLAMGFDPPQVQQMEMFLFALFRQPPDVRVLQAEDWTRMLMQCLGMPADQREIPKDACPPAPEPLPRILVIAGRRRSELFRVVEYWAASRLPRPIFAAATQNNLGFPLGVLVMHLLEEHRRFAPAPDTPKNE